MLCSFFYSQIQRKYKISSVILLVFTGIIFQLLVSFSKITISIPSTTLKLFGTLGLLIIVLEAVMDMEIHRGNRKILAKSIVAAVLIVIITTLLIGTAFAFIYNFKFINAVIYAVPLAIVSSAIAIPSVTSLTKSATQEFLVLESVFSDITGVLLFNFLITAELTKISSIAIFSLSIFLMLLISIVTTLFLAKALNREKTKNSHVVILAFLVLIYSIANCFHLSALILILIFGLTLKNLPALMETNFGNKLLGNHLNHDIIDKNLKNMKEFIEDAGFIVRSIFFILLGYSIALNQLLNFKVLIFGSLTIVVIYLVRGIILKLFVDKKEALLAITIAPRGLITVLLFIQIPEKFKLSSFDSGITFFIVIATSLIMTYGMIQTNKKA